MKKNITMIITALAAALLCMVSVKSVEAASEGNIGAKSGVRFVENETDTTDTTDSSSGSSSSSSSGPTGPNGGNQGGGKDINKGSGGKTYYPATGEIAGGGLLLLIGALIVGYVIRQKQKMKQL